jgi:cytochrome P450
VSNLKKIKKNNHFNTISHHSGNGVKLPEGSNIVIPVMTMHKRKDIWGEDADEFNPDHFAPEFKRHAYSFLPFSGGPRICIGYQYAYMSMATAVADLIRHYKFSTDLTLDKLKWDFCITLQLINKHMVSVEKRVW